MTVNKISWLKIVDCVVPYSESLKAAFSLLHSLLHFHSFYDLKDRTARGALTGNRIRFRWIHFSHVPLASHEANQRGPKKLKITCFILKWSFWSSTVLLNGHLDICRA